MYNAQWQGIRLFNKNENKKKILPGDETGNLLWAACSKCLGLYYTVEFFGGSASDKGK